MAKGVSRSRNRFIAPRQAARIVERAALLAVMLAMAPALVVPAASAAPLAAFSLAAATRTRACGSPPLTQVGALDAAARRVAGGESLRNAVQASGYRARNAALLSLDGVRNDADLERAIGNACGVLATPGLRDAGLYQQGRQIWLVIAEPFVPPKPDAAATAKQVLDLVNRARAQSRRCGERLFGVTRPVRWSPVLERAAAAHARDMAARGRMDHAGSEGSTPSQRVSRTGYAWLATGENVAAGQADAEAVTASWLASPGHCANVMNPDFTEMAVAFATNAKAESGIYWTQVFAAPLQNPPARRR